MSFKVKLNEYNLMERFSLSISDETIRENLYHSLKGKGAFSRFKDKVNEYRLSGQWYKYRDSELKEIAIYWCEDHNIEYFE